MTATRTNPAGTALRCPTCVRRIRTALPGQTATCTATPTGATHRAATMRPDHDQHQERA